MSKYTIRSGGASLWSLASIAGDFTKWHYHLELPADCFKSGGG